MKKSILALLFVFALASLKGQNYEIVYMADPSVVNNSTWLSNIKTNWKATGINLVIRWSDSETPNYWQSVTNALSAIDEIGGLNIYIRISMYRLPPTLDGSLTNSDLFQIRSNGWYYFNPYHTNVRMLNYTHPTSKETMNAFVTTVVQFLNSKSSAIKSKIKVIIPTFSADDESEYTTTCNVNGSIVEESSGFSSAEKYAFQEFLQTRYGTIQNLRNKWNPNGSSPSSFNEIYQNLSNYNWSSIGWGVLLNTITFPAGRKDWLDFKVEQLSNLINGISSIIKPSFKFGLQFSTLYSNALERAGRYDTTPIIYNTNPDLVIEDDTPHGRPNFEFHSNLLRSVCKYVSITKNRVNNPIKFGTETNWLDFDMENMCDINNTSQVNAWPAKLADDWLTQVSTSHKYGGSIMFVSQWGTEEFPLQKEAIISNTASTRYSNWKNYLATIISQYNAIDIFSSQFRIFGAAHVGFSQILYRRDGWIDGAQYARTADHNIYWNQGAINDCSGSECVVPDYEYMYNYGETVVLNKTKNGEMAKWLYPLPKFYNASTDYKDNSWYLGQISLPADIVSDYIIETNPSYLSNYSSLCLTAASYYMSDGAYNNLLNSSISKCNITYSSVLGGNAISSALKTSYNTSRNSLLKISSPQEFVSKIEIPFQLSLAQNYPNPFNPITVIKYSVPIKDLITLKIYDILGREVSSLVNDIKEAGNYSITFDGSKLSSGVYIYKLSSSIHVMSKKLLLVK